MGAKRTRLTHKTVIQLHLVAESCTICSSCSRRPVRKLLDTPSYVRESWFLKVNVKVVSVFLLNEHHAMKAYWGVEV
jgi:hypothetical protein